MMGTSVATSCVTTVLYTEESTRVVHVGVGVTTTVLRLRDGCGALSGLVIPACTETHHRFTKCPDIVSYWLVGSIFV